MNIKDNNQMTFFFRNTCIAMIWLICFYSTVIQVKFFQIQNGMLLLGAAILICYIIAYGDRSYDIREFLTEESICMLFFMAYMLVVGYIVSPSRSSHISQWIRCMEYLFIQIVIASLIKSSGTETFQVLLLAEAVVLAFVFLRNPINYHASGRYSISNELNPNGLGMSFAAGIWAVLYRQYEKKYPLILSGTLVALFGYCIMLTASRKALIAAGIIIFLWLLLCLLPSLKERGGIKAILVFLTMLFLVITIGRAFLRVYAGSTIAIRMNSMLNEASESSRADMYRAGYEMLKGNPLFGIGFQGFKYNYQFYSHATLVEVPVSSGIIGALLYFTAYFLSIGKTIILCRNTRGIPELANEYMRVKMDLILWMAMLFYTTCIIHPYQFDSYVIFGIIFGETAYIEKKITMKTETTVTKRIGNRYIKYE